ncbi:MAG: M48 family metalloprotease [Proteobacteria bacterium]|nr:M48 family metalloprotease [Pseudomonadota bacterium]MBU1387290.1 M48 family metalloprotease [Pseudomonadota bacterium]MBU1544271.1 M48 family metalloprotease [Pseudomonadota bacterium]MBU2430621.1 M48 family metalloprotease [Pseudomonadota bacterium]MBU2481481.1 M48 family metalloprotease [Pseudomonadota bacterium]
MDDIYKENQVSRRQFLKYTAAVSAATAGAGWLAGCALNPVTGEKQLMMVSREQEIGIDKNQSPFQFSSDYGVTQDSRVNYYVADIGKKVVPYVHRKDMPYNFQCVNAVYVNAYAFPGGTIAVTRGILLKLDNEAQLAALLGHELGHVNARHSAQQMSKGQLSSLLVGGLAMAAGSRSSDLGDLTQQLGALGQGLLLSKYSRDNEREADELGNEYMVRSGYSTTGFVDLMEILNSLHKEAASSVQVLFSTHPMSSERLESARERGNGRYAKSKTLPLNRDRYMDSIASLRQKEKGIVLLQQGEKSMGAKEYDKAQHSFQEALKSMDDDYTAHVLMAKCMMARKNPRQALVHSQNAQQLYPMEAQGYQVAGDANLSLKRWADAYREYDKCEDLLPGNPHLKFLKGYCQDKNGQIKPAAQNYADYLKVTNYAPNQYSKFAYSRLKTWGYAK